MNCHSDWITGVAFSPDGHRLVTNGSGRESVRLWDMESRQQGCTLPIEKSHFRFLQFSDNSRGLAFSTTSGQIRIITVELPHWLVSGDDGETRLQ